MTWSRLFPLALLISGLASAPLSSQRPLIGSWLDSGTVVRLQLRSGAREAGRLLAPLSPDSTTLRYCLYPAPACTLGGERYVVRPTVDVAALELHAGTHATRWALFGGGVGLALDALYLGFVRSYACGDVGNCNDTTRLILFPAVLAGIGALIGGTMHRWVAVP